MDYTQSASTGAIDDQGSPLRANMETVTGCLEIDASSKLLKNSMHNLTSLFFSQNTNVTIVDDKFMAPVNLGDTEISYSPKV
jgi:hypothetical protein